ncbi:hypothetical protein [Acidimangrovimonas sediminis]|uniref:hypothetical protein n=1 Tax=Acidimangrovimonas sediminis TaxID=2056283 RepID=UPI001304EB37|nr:hypothetical protein [Acidimangrovimonas sediminis]
MKTERRWMKWVLEESAKPQPAMPWQRSQRRRPEALRTAERPAPKPLQVFAAE